MRLSDALAATTQPEPLKRDRPSHPKGWEPGYEWNGSAGHITTGPLGERPTTWDAYLVDAGLDPELVEVIEPVQVRGWDTTVAKRDETGARYSEVVRAHYYRLNTRLRTLRADIDDLVRAAKSRKPQKSPPDHVSAGRATKSTQAFVVALGDLQLGKADGDGVEGTLERFFDKTNAAVARYKRVAKGSPIYLFHLGDCIEGFVSQGGANAWRTTLTTTEQVRLYRRILLEQVKAFAAITNNLVVAGIPGNHDEANRPLHTYGDSWAIDALSAVDDALRLAGGYDHVSVHAPARDELTLTFDVAGTTIGLAHGHQFRGGWQKWWSGQSHGRQPIGDVDMLIAGHFHHLNIVRESRTFIQVPALESESTWFRHGTGRVSQPGIVTLVTGGGAWRGLEVL